MKFLTLLLFTPLYLFGQTGKFLEGSGINPQYISCIGKESGWVQLCAGPMAQKGQVFKIYFENWKTIKSIKMKVFDPVEISQGLLEASGKIDRSWIGYERKVPLRSGECIFVFYKVEYKKA